MPFELSTLNKIAHSLYSWKYKDNSLYVGQGRRHSYDLRKIVPAPYKTNTLGITHRSHASGENRYGGRRPNSKITTATHHTNRDSAEGFTRVNADVGSQQGYDISDDGGLSLVNNTRVGVGDRLTARLVNYGVKTKARVENVQRHLRARTWSTGDSEYLAVGIHPITRKIQPDICYADSREPQIINPNDICKLWWKRNSVCVKKLKLDIL